jgi:hypothetical protein
MTSNTISNNPLMVGMLVIGFPIVAVPLRCLTLDTRGDPDRFHPRHLLWTVNVVGEDAILVKSTVRMAKLVVEHSKHFAVNLDI